MNLTSANYIYLPQNFQIHYNFCTFHPLVISHVINIKNSLPLLHTSAAAADLKSKHPQRIPSLFVSPPTVQHGSFEDFRIGEALGSRFSIQRRYTLVQWCPSMGQVLDKFQGKQWRQRQIRKITDKVFDHIKNDDGRANLTFEDLYIAILLVYNDMNKKLPGPHFDPPSKELVREKMQECDINLDGEIDREEFGAFIEKLTVDTFITVSQGLLVTLVVAPTVAVATKRATEGVPGVGKVVQRLPNSVYASLITLAIVLFQRSSYEAV